MPVYLARKAIFKLPFQIFMCKTSICKMFTPAISIAVSLLTVTEVPFGRYETEDHPQEAILFLQKLWETVEASRLFQSISLESCLLLYKEELTCLSKCTADSWPRASVTSAPSPCWGYRCVPQTQVLWIEARPSCLCADTLSSHIQIHMFTLPLTSTEVV